MHLIVAPNLQLSTIPSHVHSHVKLTGQKFCMATVLPGPYYRRKLFRICIFKKNIYNVSDEGELS